MPRSPANASSRHQAALTRALDKVGFPGISARDERALRQYYAIILNRKLTEGAQ